MSDRPREAIRRHPTQPGHPADCWEVNCAYIASTTDPPEDKPENMSDFSWFEVFVRECAEGCPMMQRSIDLGRRLAREHGW